MICIGVPILLYYTINYVFLAKKIELFFREKKRKLFYIDEKISDIFMQKNIVESCQIKYNTIKNIKIVLKNYKLQIISKEWENE